MGPRIVQRPTQKGDAKKHDRQAQRGVEGSTPHRQGRSLCCHTARWRKGTGHTPSLDQPVTAPENRKQYQQARHSGRCGSNPIPKRRQQGVGPAEPLVSTAIRQGGGKGREGKSQRATQPHTTRTTNKPNKGGSKRKARREKEAARHSKENQHHTNKPTKATRRRHGRGSKPMESHQGNQHTCTYQKSERGAK